MKKQTLLFLVLTCFTINTYAQTVNSIKKVTILSEKVRNDFKAKNDSITYYAKNYLEKEFNTPSYFKGTYKYDDENQVLKITYDSIKPFLLKIPNNELSSFMNNVKALRFSNLAVNLLDYSDYEFISGDVSSEEFESSYQIDNSLEFVTENSFTLTEVVPIYPGCSGSNDKLYNCFIQKISQHIGDNFNTDLASKLDLPVGKCIKYYKRNCVKREGKKYRISTTFQVNKLGQIDSIEATAPHPRLEKEAIRVLKLVPQIKPGMVKGKPVKVKYSLPITFLVTE